MYIFLLVVTLLEKLFSHINEVLQLMKKYLLAEIKAVMFMEKKTYMLKKGLLWFSHNPSLKTSPSSSFKSFNPKSFTSNSH